MVPNWSEIVRSSRSLYLEQEYSSVYSWFRNSGLETASGVSGQIKVKVSSKKLNHK